MKLAINSSGAAVSAVLACTAAAQTPNPPAPATGTPIGIGAMAVTMPPVRYACISFSLPEDEEAAKTTIDAARQKWLDAARTAGLKESSNIFFHAAVPQAATTTAIPAQACAIVDSQANLSGMTMLDLPARAGVAGFCEKQLDVQDCLVSVAKQLDFTDAKPWPWLPIYARWAQDAQAPKTAQDVVSYLTTNKLELRTATSGGGATVEQSSQGLKPLIPCTDCPAAQQRETLTPAGAGVGWFLQNVVLPSPSPDQDLDKGKPGQ